MNRKPEKDWWPTPVVEVDDPPHIIQSVEWECASCHVRIYVKVPEDGSKPESPVGWLKAADWHCPTCAPQLQHPMSSSNLQLGHSIYKPIDKFVLVRDTLDRYHNEVAPTLPDHQRLSFGHGSSSRMFLEIIAIMIEEAFKQ